MRKRENTKKSPENYFTQYFMRNKTEKDDADMANEVCNELIETL